MNESIDEKYVRLAILEAKRSQNAGGAPIGAVLVSCYLEKS